MSPLFLKRKNEKRLLALTGALFFFSFASAGDIKYPARSIPPGITKNANVVKRSEEMELRIINSGEVLLYHKYALTILNEKGDDYAAFVEYYDKLQKIISVEGQLYDAAGNELEALRRKDIIDLSAVDDNSFMDDTRKKAHRFYCKTYPYTVAYEVRLKFNHTLFFPAWMPVEGEHFAVEQSAYTIICPADYSFRYRAFNFNGTPSVSSEKDKKIMKWEIKELPGLSKPYAAPPWNELTTAVYFAPGDFEMENYKGNMNSWQAFGKFVYALKKDRDHLPPGVIQKVKELTDTIAGEKEKVRVLYQYLQHQTRYVSVQLGLGGWQPFDARYVAEKGYGDCKALVNYMYSLLEAAGISSYYSLVKAGSGESMLDSFPSQQFNHVILSVPLQKDTIWLECTSQDMPAGYLGAFTANRKALLIKEDGGTLVATPKYSIEQNTLLRRIKAKLQPDGSLGMQVKTVYAGIQQDELSMMIHNLPKGEVQKTLQRAFELSTYNVNGFSYEETKAAIPQLNERLDIAVSGYAAVSGRRLFITPNILNRASTEMDAEEHRTVDLVINDEWRDEDNYEIEIPADYGVELMPPDVSLKTKFGTYTCTTALQANKIIYHRTREQFSGRFPAKDQAELARFFEQVYRADRNKMVLVKKAS